jgi:hypothetical protein
MSGVKADGPYSYGGRVRSVETSRAVDGEEHFVRPEPVGKHDKASEAVLKSRCTWQGDGCRHESARKLAACCTNQHFNRFQGITSAVIWVPPVLLGPVVGWRVLLEFRQRQRATVVRPGGEQKG